MDENSPNQIQLFKSVFKGREDVFAVRWEKETKSGYMPAYFYDPYIALMYLYLMPVKQTIAYNNGIFFITLCIINGCLNQPFHIVLKVQEGDATMYHIAF